MTFREVAIKMLTERGMFQDEAEKVMNLVIADPRNAAMGRRWNDHVEGYPPTAVNILWLAVSHSAREYIAKECPRAWFRELFENKSEEASA